MESPKSSSDSEGEYNDGDFIDHFDLEADKNRIVEHSPKGRFIRFNEELGCGAYKTVYKGYDNETGCEVAWNIIKLPKLPPKERKRISDEIALLKKLKHPNIISFISAWINKQKEEIVFITEVVTGGSLKKYLKKIKSPRLKVIKSWCREILKGIEYLHELKPHPIIHRDIKCDNIFINSNKGEIRIGDLGLATLMSNPYAASVLGTPEFMAPEMYDEVYGPSVDIYSFGMCLLEMVTNQTPYRECMNPAQIYKKVINGIKPASLELIANDEVKSFICECLKPRDERPSATELINHHFIQSIDQEADNQPVALHESPIETLKEEEISNVTRPETHIQKHFNYELNDEGDEKQGSPELSINHTEPTDETYQKEESTLKKRKTSDCVDDKRQESFGAPGIEKFKSFDQISNILNNQRLTEKEFKEDVKFEANQEKIELSYQKQLQQAPMRKDQAKYSFHSKGVINGNLVIFVKADFQGRLFEQKVEIRRDKISNEKITNKLQKHLAFLPIANDTDFRNKVKALLESIDYLNVSNSMHSGLPPLNSATSIQVKSPSNANFETHSHFEKSSNIPFHFHLFTTFYDNYMSHLTKDGMIHETEEAMALRQQGELLELQNRHLLQRRSLWDKKHNVLSNSTLAMQSQTVETEDAHHRLNQIYDSHFKHSDIKIKDLGQNNFFVSPLSSGPLSPTISGENVCSANISVEIMASLLRKLGNFTDEQNHHPDNFSENEKIPKSNLISPNSQDVLNKFASDKSGNVFKFPGPFNPTAMSQSSNITNTTNKFNMENHTVHSNVTSPKDIPHIIGSPKGFKNLVYASQNNKSTPMKSVSDKEELHQRKQDNQFHLIIEEKDEERLVKSQVKLCSTVNTQAKKQGIIERESKPALVDVKKENRFGSLTINTDIANQSESTQTPSQTQGHQSGRSRNGESKKADGTETNNKNLSETQADNKVDSLELCEELKKSNSLPKPTTIGNNCASTLIKQSSFRDQTQANSIQKNRPANPQNNVEAASQLQQTNITKVPELQGNSNLNKSGERTNQPTNSIPNQVGHGNRASTIPSKPTENTAVTPNGGVLYKEEQKEESNIKKYGEAKTCSFKRQPTYEVLKSVKSHRLSQTLGRHINDMHTEDIKILQLCLELLTGQETSPSGQFTPYMENQVKIYQEKFGLIADGLVTPSLWEKMINSIEKMEKKWMTKEYLKQKELDDMTKNREDLKKKN